jgi:hypothetical protein
LSLYLTNEALHHEGIRGNGCLDPRFLDLGTRWRSVVNLCSGIFTHGEMAPGTYYVGGWVGLRAGLDDLEKRKYLTLPGLELRSLGRPARSQSLYLLGYPGSVLNVVSCFIVIIILTGVCKPLFRKMYYIE